ncbi:hypothetical protein Pmani_011247 [Petrolisthes manimaculis]|uniref:Cytochrome P450 n=1 Tax=Petrolisthes manimaculis TaxID=1843537 RepID=A0AAE1PZU4_9EUCA|nr:hypothetical protein Pmani_011247 [Petrolisthes manimaculis]
MLHHHTQPSSFRQRISLTMMASWAWEVWQWMAYLLATILFATLLVRHFKRRRMVALINKLPGPEGLPLLGNSLQVTVDNAELFKLIIQFCQYGEVMKLWFGPDPLVILSSPRAAEAVLSSSRHIEKSHDYHYLHSWLGTGLLTSSGSKWHSRRKLLTPAFHFKILEDCLEVFDRQATLLVDRLRPRADGQPFDILSHIALCTLDIICEAAMGHVINAQNEEDSEYVKKIKKINYLMQRRMTVIWEQPSLLYWLLGLARQRDECLSVLHNFSKETITNRRKINQQNVDEKSDKKQRLAFLDILLEYSGGTKGLSDEDIREEVDTFMFEGHDTTAAAISWSLFLLGHHPEIQAKVHEELDAILTSPDQPLGIAELRQMKYTENCIKEALRLLPSVPYLGRVLSEDLNICGNVIPAHTNVLISIYMIHRDPVQFPDPEKFDPNRFLPENTRKRHPYAYIPFSAGPRNCIGQKFALLEEKAVLGRLLRQYSVVSEIKPLDIKLLGELILRPRGGNLVRLLPRH